MTALQYHQEQAARLEFALLMMRMGCKFSFESLARVEP